MAFILNFSRPGRETRSGDPVGRPGRETLLEHPREYRIFVAVAPRIENRFGFKLMVTLISNSMINYSISTINTKVIEGGRSPGFQTIFIKACKSTGLLVHGRWLLYVQKKSNLYFFDSPEPCSGLFSRLSF